MFENSDDSKLRKVCPAMASELLNFQSTMISLYQLQIFLIAAYFAKALIAVIVSQLRSMVKLDMAKLRFDFYKIFFGVMLLIQIDNTPETKVFNRVCKNFIDDYSGDDKKRIDKAFDFMIQSNMNSDIADFRNGQIINI